MRRGKFIFLLVLVFTTLFWALTDPRWLPGRDVHQLRAAIVQYSGVIAIVCMVFAALISTRPRWLEPAFGGLDKMYLIHKWLGITTLVFASVHWWFALGARQILGWIFKGAAAPKEPVPPLMHALHVPAHIIGEWCFYVLVILLVIALWRRISYRVFALTHMLMTLLLALLLFHTVVLTRQGYWSEPFGWFIGTVVAIGLACVLVIAFRRFGKGHEVEGVVERQTYYPELKVLETEIHINRGWPGHKAGQFAFAKTSLIEGGHPFTMASDWDPKKKRMLIMAKELGDFTSRLRHEYTVGRRLRLEGPYGCFDFEDGMPTQIWIGAGIGITPFLARMRQLARNGHAQDIHLFHPTSDADDAVLDMVMSNATAAGIELHIHLTPRDGRLDGGVIREQVPDWRRSSVWFCGPFAFGKALRRDFTEHGLNARHFHQERFELR
ncbi:ferric reductase-like transmembrane domain-containing protein [Oleiagrimonas sp.]|jgi:predicted ferric reductase|uniref:ferredoxin reductase family protein n=1 Tax=Oleiagrimonas sp. TaxID=2010330 RepID=UPI00262A94FB|nr:ferric reductase-like transmembrane domain-containing protein [Oleiagrimonas sp.]MDA3914994.1 ferric reductase-like transmembrane domain-containing protein [Oleiagrimonas sp.]